MGFNQYDTVDNWHWIYDNTAVEIEIVEEVAEQHSLTTDDLVECLFVFNEIAYEAYFEEMLAAERIHQMYEGRAYYVIDYFDRDASSESRFASPFGKSMYVNAENLGRLPDAIASVEKEAALDAMYDLYTALSEFHRQHDDLDRSWQGQPVVLYKPPRQVDHQDLIKSSLALYIRQYGSVARGVDNWMLDVLGVSGSQWGNLTGRTHQAVNGNRGPPAPKRPE